MSIKVFAKNNRKDLEFERFSVFPPKYSMSFQSCQKLSPLFSTQFSVLKVVKAVILGSYREVLVQYV
jgi:hypothetical protein